MGIIGLVFRCNLRWVLSFVIAFVFASATLANASWLAQVYSSKVTEQVLGFANNDFVVSQKGMADKAREVHGRLAGLEDVRYVVSMVCLRLRLAVPDGGWGVALVYCANGTGIAIGDGVPFVSYIGLENVLNESELATLLPDEENGTVLSSELSHLLDVGVSGEFKVYTPFTNLTFRVDGITDHSQVSVWNKIDKPTSLLTPVALPQIQLPPELFPEADVRNPFPGVFFLYNPAVFLTVEDAVDMCAIFSEANLQVNPEIEILHYVFTERVQMVDPGNMDLSAASLNETKKRLELLLSDMPVKVDSLALQSLEALAPAVNSFMTVAYGYMLAALPLFWFITYELAGMFADRKERETTLFRIRGTSARSITNAYVVVLVVAVLIGCGLSALVQANLLGVQIQQYTEYSVGTVGTRVLGIVFPDATTFAVLLVSGLVLAFLAVRRIAKGGMALHALAIDDRFSEEDASPKRVGKLPLILLFLGLVKVGMVLGGLDPSVYFRYSPPNPYMAMAVGLFAAFDVYALTALAPLFISYGFARIVTAHPEKFLGLIKVFSYLGGSSRQKVAFRLSSSKMWRTASVLLMVTLLIAYGVGSFICNGSLREHVWKMAGGFAGGDIRIDCLPNATAGVENALRELDDKLEYARIDLAASRLIITPEGDRKTFSFHFVSLLIIDPMQAADTLYFDNDPRIRQVVSSLEKGQIIGLTSAPDPSSYRQGEPFEAYFPKADSQLDSESLRNSSNWYEVVYRQWEDWPLPGTIENSRTIRVSYSLRTLTTISSVPDEPVYPELLTENLYMGSFHLANFTDLSQRMASYVEEGSLWKVGEFLVTNETVSNMRSLHYKTHFVIKPRTPVQAGELASTLRTRLAENAMVITREEAASIITRSSPKVATSLAFVQTNSVLITLVSFGGIAIATVTSVAARTQTFALLRTRGARRTSCIALFAPEAAFVSLMGAVLGVLLGLALAVGFSASLTYFVTPLFTGNPFQMIIDQTVWLYVVLILVVSTITYAVAVFKLAKIGRGIG